MLNGLDLFSGIGGMSIALREWVRPLLYCEIDPYCQAVLLNRQLDGLLPRAPIWDDVTNLCGSGDQGDADIIYGGFPCQDISIAGRGEGLAGKRSGLFYQILRLLRETRSRFIFLENVPAITGRGGSEIVREITSLGYDCRWCVISAASVGAKHKRERWFLLAHSNINTNRRDIRKLSTQNEEQQKPKEYRKEKTSKSIYGCQYVADTRCECPRIAQESERSPLHLAGCSRYWEVEPSVGRVANGVLNRVDRIRSLGNAVVPAQAKKAFKILMGIS